MRKNIDEKKAEMAGRYVKSRRHTIQVDYADYIEELANLIDCNPSFVECLKTDPKLAYLVSFPHFLP